MHQSWTGGAEWCTFESMAHTNGVQFTAAHQECAPFGLVANLHFAQASMRHPRTHLALRPNLRQGDRTKRRRSVTKLLPINKYEIGRVRIPLLAFMPKVRISRPLRTDCKGMDHIHRDARSARANANAQRVVSRRKGDTSVGDSPVAIRLGVRTSSSGTRYGDRVILGNPASEMLLPVETAH